VVRTPEDLAPRGEVYALLVTCTHLGCTPNFLSAEAKFKCPTTAAASDDRDQRQGWRPQARCGCAGRRRQILVDKARSSKRAGAIGRSTAFLKL
jgi:cytochrome b6-f complex iron-sulfur subunit